MAEIIGAFHFIRPFWLLAMIPAILTVVWLLKQTSAASGWTSFVAPHLLQHLLDQNQVQSRKWPIWGALVLWSIAILALAGPAWKEIPQPVQQNTQALVICWDLSPSMLAQDIKPSRLERARLKIIDLLNARDEGLFALIAYSGEAYNVTPLTDDTQTLINLLPALSPTYLPTVGSNPEMAYDNAKQLLKDAGATDGHIVFVTDGIAPSAFETMIQASQSEPYQVTLWGVGSKEGAPIPLPSGGFLKDNSGNMVIAKLEEQQLQDFAKQLGAFYVPMAPSDQDVKTVSTLLMPDKKHTQESQRTFDQWFEHGQYLVFLCLPFALLLFRRGWVFGLVFCVSLFGQSPTAQALSWQGLWKNRDQQAQTKLEAGDPNAAAEFTTPSRRGAAYYEQQDYQNASEAFSQLEDVESLYSKGAALTHAGEYEQAVQAFDQALSIDPDFSKAAKGKSIAESLAALQQQPQQQKQNQEGSDSENQQGDSQQQDGQDSQSQEGNQNQDSQQPSDNGQQTSGEGQSQQNQQQDQAATEQSAEEEQAGQNDTAAAEQSGDGKQTPEENPYANVDPEEQSAGEQEQVQSQGLQEEASGNEAEQQAMALTGSSEANLSEEQQQLEMMLRKVPDDPGGLLREKFRYQYQQRQYDPTQSFKNKDAENRW